MRFLFFVPRAGIEPAHLAVLVFETNASTYSAIWAYLRMQRYGIFSETPNFSLKNSIIPLFLASKGIIRIATNSHYYPSVIYSLRAFPPLMEGNARNIVTPKAGCSQPKALHEFTSLFLPSRPSSWRDIQGEPYQPDRRGHSKEEQTS